VTGDANPEESVELSYGTTDPTTIITDNIEASANVAARAWDEKYGASWLVTLAICFFNN
jgi:hypothetical protein